jgi:site-specific recombinase XerD
MPVIGNRYLEPEGIRMNKVSISQAIEGYLFAAQARRLSNHTIADYQVAFRKFLGFLGDDLPLDKINSRLVEMFLASQNSVSKKTLLNYHISLSALWTWMIKEELVEVHLLHKVDRPKPERREVVAQMFLFGK